MKPERVYMFPTTSAGPGQNAVVMYVMYDRVPRTRLQRLVYRLRRWFR